MTTETFRWFDIEGSIKNGAVYSMLDTKHDYLFTKVADADLGNTTLVLGHIIQVGILLTAVDAVGKDVEVIVRLQDQDTEALRDAVAKLAKIKWLLNRCIKLPVIGQYAKFVQEVRSFVDYVPLLPHEYEYCDKLLGGQTSNKMNFVRYKSQTIK